MQGISLLLTITKREFEQEFTSFLQQRGISAIFSALCRGTAGQNILNLLGIEKTEKVLLFAMMESKKAARLMREMVSDMGINMPGNGIALRMPVGSIGGASCMKYLMEKQDIIIGEVTDMEEKQSFPYELIVAIAERGSMDMVMEAARSANAGGGTILHAKGTGTDFTSKFFGVSIAAEKEMIFIVSTSTKKKDIMRAIVHKAGMDTPACSIVFSAPLSAVAGLRTLDEE